MKCPKCQFENRVGATFCGKCGAEILSVCPQCNTENPPDNSYCDKCGHKLSQSESSGPLEQPSIEEPASFANDRY